MTSESQTPKTAKLVGFFRKAMKYLLGYLLLGVIMVALMFLLFRIRMDTILIFDALEYEIWEIRSVTDITIVVMGILLFVGFAISEDRLRKAIAENRMWKVLLRIYLATAAAWIIEIGIYNLAVWIIYT